jgi:tRNA threonylcarbamoyladenosine biosynthesis protein TsaB
MLILGVDTPGRNGSIALVRFAAEAPRIIEVVALEGGTFSAQLVPQISGLLGKHGLTKKDIDAFAVVSGPGSFTGLRVGLAAIKALAEILHKPIAAVSLLEAVAFAAKKQGNIVAALDAGRGEVYVAEYKVDDLGAKLITQELLSGTEFVERFVGTTVITPDARIADLAVTNKISLLKVDPPRADVIARLGFEKLRAGETVSAEALDANYIRRSDAEIVRSSYPQP